ncbi:MAG: aminoacetone oxidase family FAD-binding enzyme, partial [Minisyncoccales bacterium]
NRDFCSKFGKEGDFLLSSFSIFGIKETMDFFENLGLKLKEEKGRVYPVSEKSKDVLNILTSLLKKRGVEIMTSLEVKDIKMDGSSISSVLLSNKKEIKAKNYIISTGGKSYPVTGSTGEIFNLIKKIGHKVTELKPSLTPIETKEPWTKNLQGISLDNVSVSLIQDGKKVKEEKGEILFTHFGLSGPLILNMSRSIGDLLAEGKVKIVLDLFGGKNIDEADKYIQKVFNKNRNKHVLKCLGDLYTEKLSAFIMNFSGVSLKRKPKDLAKEERERLIKFIKGGIELNVVGLLGFDRAMATHGGISLKEIDSKTMKSKLINNLYFSGEAIDLDGLSGGYNLQMCWTTGYIAGKSAAIAS